MITLAIIIALAFVLLFGAPVRRRIEIGLERTRTICALPVSASRKLSLAAHITLQALIVSFVCTPCPSGCYPLFVFSA